MQKTVEAPKNEERKWKIETDSGEKGRGMNLKKKRRKRRNTE